MEDVQEVVLQTVPLHTLLTGTVIRLLGDITALRCHFNQMDYQMTMLCAGEEYIVFWCDDGPTLLDGSGNPRVDAEYFRVDCNITVFVLYSL